MRGTRQRRCTLLTGFQYDFETPDDLTVAVMLTWDPAASGSNPMPLKDTNGDKWHAEDSSDFADDTCEFSTLFRYHAERSQGDGHGDSRRDFSGRSGVFKPAATVSATP